MKKYLAVAGISGALSVALSAFGTHGLKGILNERMMAIFHTASEYQMYHSLALLIVVLISLQFSEAKLLQWSARFFLWGILLFSGSLYTLSLTGITWLGAIAPVGGTFLILGWLTITLFAIKLNQFQRKYSNK